MKNSLAKKHNSNSVLFMWLFFIILILVYGRGPSFNAELSELQDKTVSKESSKAPFLIISTLFLIYQLAKEKRLHLKNVANYKLWIVYLIANFLLVFVRGNFSDDLKGFGTIFFSFSLLLLFLNFIYDIPYQKLERHFIYISFTISIVAAVDHILQGTHIVFFPDRSDGNFDRLGGLFYYAHTAALLAITLLFSIKKYLSTREIKFLIICGICGVLMIATDTRSAWFASALSLVFIAFKRVKFYKLFIFSILFYFIATTLASMVKTTTLSNTGDDAAFREQIWAYSLLRFAASPIAGYGLANPFESGASLLSERLRDPHNSILSLLLQSGLVGSLIYFFIYVKNSILAASVYLSEYRFLFFFWIFFPFFWGRIYNDLSSFISMYMMFTIYAFALNPNFTSQTNPRNGK